MLDIFSNDAFSNASLTAAINLLPYRIRRIGQMKLFETKNPRVNTVYIERKDGRIAILESKPRNSGETTKNNPTRRDIVPLMLPYIPLDDAVTPADVAGVREFGEEEQLEMVTTVVNEKLASLRDRHEQTHEWHRLGAIKGQILDGDAAFSELLDMFDVFGVNQTEVGFDIKAGSNVGVKAACAEVIGVIEEALGGMVYDHIHALVGNEFFQDLVNYSAVTAAYTAPNHPQNDFLVQQQSAYGTNNGKSGSGANQVFFGGITFENYRGKIGAKHFIEPDEAHFFPVGVPGLFQMHFGPAETMSNVNRPGQPITVLTEDIKFDGGKELHSESNPLAICTMPEVLVHGFSGLS